MKDRWGKCNTPPLPTAVKVSKALANVLEGDHTEAAMARLLGFSGGVSSAVPIDMPMISMAGWSPLGNRSMEIHSFRGDEHRRAIQQLSVNAATRELPRIPITPVERINNIRQSPQQEQMPLRAQRTYTRR